LLAQCKLSDEAKYPELVEGLLMSWYVYIAKVRTDHYYVGISTDPKQRIVKNNAGNDSQMAAQQGPFILIYTSEPYLNKSMARTREAQIKRWTRAKKEKLIAGKWK